MTIQQVKEFCDETRQLAAQIEAYVTKWEDVLASQGNPPQFTKRERLRAAQAEMRLELALERL